MTPLLRPMTRCQASMTLNPGIPLMKPSPLISVFPLLTGGLILSTVASERPASAPLKIMPLGDSITAGYFTTDGGYRRYLHELLTQSGLKVDFVGRSVDQSGDMKDPEHEGYSGFTIAQIHAKAIEAIGQFTPDIILLFAGTNDIRLNGRNDDPADPIYWKTAPQRLEAMLADIAKSAPKAVVIVGSLLPYAGSWAEREPAAKEFNAALTRIVADQQRAGRPVYIVDFRKTITPEDLSDGLHPNASGYRKMADTWYQAIGRVLKTKQTLTETRSH